MNSKVIAEVASRTNVPTRPEEDYTDYLDRLNETHNIDESDRKRLETLTEKELFAPDSGLSDSEKRDVIATCNRVFGNESAGSNGVDGFQISTPQGDRISSNRQQNGLHGYAETNKIGSPPSSSGSEAVSTQLGKSSWTSTNRTWKRLRRAFTRSDMVYLLPLLVCGAFVFFYGLGNFPLSTSDEGFYANLARHMVQDGYWVVPHMYYAIGLRPSGFEPWLKLPPLGIWLQAVSMLVFGVNEFAVRFPSAAASTLTVVVVYFVGRDIESRRAGFIAGLVFLTTPFVYAGFNAGRDGGLDSLLVLFGSLFVYTAWLAVSRNERRWLYPMGLFAGFAVLTKGFGAGVFLIVALPLVFLAQRVFVSREMFYAVGFTGIMTLPWPIYMYLQYGDTFVQEFVVRYVIERAAGGAFGANTNTLFSFMEYPYITQLLFSPDFFHPWTFVLVVGVPAYAYRRFTAERRSSALESGFLIWWTVAALGLFVFIGNKPWYILPMYVPAAVVVGGVVDDAIKGQLGEILVVALGAGILLIVSPAYSITVTPEMSVTPGVVFAVGAISVVWAAPVRDEIAGRLPALPSKSLQALTPIFVSLVIVSSFVGVPPTSGNPAQQTLAEELNSQSPEPELVFIESEMERPFHAFSFYAQRPLETGSVDKLRSSGARYAIVTEDSLSQVDSYTEIIKNETIDGRQKVSLVEVSQ